MTRTPPDARGDQSMGYSNLRAAAVSLVSSVCILSGLAWPRTSEAQAVPLVFQSTFNIPEWAETPTRGDTDAQLAPDGDGISGNGGWITLNGSVDQVTVAANNPAGGGGRGFRHWVGDGLNNAGGGIVVSFTPVSEMWFRYYIRFQAGFAWDPSTIFMKTIYCNRGLPGTFYFGLHEGVVGGHIEAMPLVNHQSSVTWAQWQGGQGGDGNFHVLEVHAKMNTTGTSSDGVFEFWLDDRPIYSNSNIHFGNATGGQFANCAVGENHNSPQNGADAYVDFDDIAISATGRIGPIGGIPAPQRVIIR